MVPVVGRVRGVGRLNKVAAVSVGICGLLAIGPPATIGGPDGWVWCVLAAASLALVILPWRVGVWVDGDVLVLKGWFGVTRIDMRSNPRFTIEKYTGYLVGQTGLYCLVLDGDARKSFSFTVSTNRRCARHRDTLNQLVQQHQ